MNTPPRIALMLPRFSHYGGVEQFAFRSAEALAKRGFAVDFICARQETDPPPGVRVIAVGRYGGLKVLKMLWFLVRAEQVRKQGEYDLAISFGKTWNQDITRVGGGPLRVFWRLSGQAWEEGLPRLLKQTSRLLQPANWLTLLIEQRMFHKTKHVVAISDTVRGWLVEEFPHLDEAGGEQHLQTIYNCPDVSRFAPPTAEQRASARKAFGVTEGTYALGVATTNFALKGVGQLISTLPLLEEDVHLHVAGGRNHGRYDALAARLGVAKRVHFHGKVRDMGAFYHALDMFVLPSFYDTLGNVVLEALGSGLKTLCSNRAGAAAFLPPEQVVQDPADVREIADKVGQLRRKTEVPPFVPKGTGIAELMQLVETCLTEKRAGGNA